MLTLKNSSKQLQSSRAEILVAILWAAIVFSVSISNCNGFPCDSVKTESNTLPPPPQCDLLVQNTNRQRRQPLVTYVMANAADHGSVIYCVEHNTFSIQHFDSTLNLRLECSASYPIQFEFDGLKPVDEISTHYHKCVQKKSNLTITSYNITIDFESRTRLTGNYVVSSIVDSTRRVELYFFMETNKEPYLLHYRKHEETIIRGNTVIVPCRSSNSDISVNLYKVKRENNAETLLQHSDVYDPRRGFLFNISTSNHKHEEGKYLCTAIKNGIKADSLTISLTFPAMDKTVTRNKSISLQLLPRNQAYCFVNNTNQEFRPKSLTNIYVANPTQAKLQQECVFQGEYCLNTDQRVGGYESFCMCLAIHQMERQGIVQCSTEDAYEIQQYFTGLDENLYVDSTKIPSSAVIQMSPVNFTTKLGYFAFEKYTFQCRISSYLLVKPIVWYKKLNNGSFIEEKMNVDRDAVNHDVWHDNLVVEICPQTSEIMCTASFWNTSAWVTASTSIRVIVRRPPKIHSKSPTTLNFTANDMVVVICEAEGYPTVKLRWLKNNHTFRTAYSNSPYFKKFLELKFFRITPNDAGEYACVAENSLGRDQVNYTFNVVDHLKESSDIGYQIAIRVPLGILILLGVVLAAFLLIKYRDRKGLSKKEIKEFERGTGNHLEMKNFLDYAHENIDAQPYDKEFEIEDSLHLESSVILGSGAYGIVLKGKYHGQSVAVKTTKAGADKMYLKALLSELKIMIFLGNHPHIIQLLGAKTNELHRGILHIIVEYCPMGNLETVLRSQNRSTFVQMDPLEASSESLYTNEDIRSDCLCTKDLMLWSFQIATAMEYMTLRKVLHGDLASRNILLLNREMAKVTDFGLSRKLVDYTAYVKTQQEPMPWRWLAIESLRSMNFSSKSDVWMFAVTLWEMFSLGDIPYQGLSWTVDFTERLEQGLRLTLPKFAKEDIYSLMLACWAISPEDRPSFSELKKNFYTQLLKLSGDKYMDLKTNTPNSG